MVGRVVGVGGAFLLVAALGGCLGDGVESMNPSSVAGGTAGAPATAPAGAPGTAPDPFAAAPICTSGTMWTKGNHGSPDMNAGRACITCHSMGEGPSLTIAGTLYPTAHEPDLCNGASGADGARVVITGADGQTLTLTPGDAGNFNSRTAVMTPFTAKVTYMGRERAMTAAQTSGDCNSCHTQAGANGAPGRILLP
jgi:hypothetical protein